MCSCSKASNSHTCERCLIASVTAEPGNQRIKFWSVDSFLLQKTKLPMDPSCLEGHLKDVTGQLQFSMNKVELYLKSWWEEVAWEFVPTYCLPFVHLFAVLLSSNHFPVCTQRQLRAKAGSCTTKTLLMLVASVILSAQVILEKYSPYLVSQLCESRLRLFVELQTDWHLFRLVWT